VSHSEGPTASPTFGPTQEQCEHGGDDEFFPKPCPEDVILLKTVGTTEFPDPTDAVKVISQDVKTVSVKLNQAWGSEFDSPPLDHIYYSYHQGTDKDVYEQKCEHSNGVDPNCIYGSLTLECLVTVPYALLEICVVDSTGFLRAGDDAKVPDCCYPEFPPETPAVCYTLEIKCVSECVEEVSRRALRGAEEQK